MLEMATVPALSWDWVGRDRSTGAGQEGGGSPAGVGRWVPWVYLIFSPPWSD